MRYDQFANDYFVYGSGMRGTVYVWYLQEEVID